MVSSVNAVSSSAQAASQAKTQAPIIKAPTAKSVSSVQVKISAAGAALAKVDPVDLKGGLYKVDNSANQGSTSFVYSMKQLKLGNVTAPTGVITLKNADETEFAIDNAFLGQNGAVTMVASGDKLSLYLVNKADGTADRYSFDAKTGIASVDGPLSLNPLDVVAEEVKTKRDIDGNGGVGGKVDRSIDTTGGLFQVSVAGKTYLTIGRNLATGTEKSPLNFSDGVLKADDGESPWEPDSSLYMVSAVTARDPNTKNITSVTIYAQTNADANGQTANGEKPNFVKFEFDSTLKLTSASEGEEATAREMSLAEVNAGRNLTGILDQDVGVSVNSTPIDKVGGLYKGTILGNEFFVVSEDAKPLNSGTNTAPQGLSTALLTSDKSAWAIDDGYAIKGILTDTVNGAKVVTVYAVNTNDPTDVVSYKFVKGDDGYINDDAGPTSVSADDLVTLEAQKKRDLNQDSFYGVQIEGPALDAVGGLYQAKVLGSKYLIVGQKLANGNAAKPLDLSTALRNSDDTAWEKPDGYNIKALIASEVNNQDGYDLYVINQTDPADIQKYRFDSTYSATQADAEPVSLVDFTALEKAQKRDINGDGAVGVTIGNPVDATGGLYRASVANTNYLIAGPKLKTGTASAPVDLSNALFSDSDGNAWDADAGLTIKSIVRTDNSASIYAVDASGIGTRFQFDRDQTSNQLILSANDSGELTSLQFSAAEAAVKRDLNGDGAVGASLPAQNNTIDAVGGLYNATFGTDSFVVIGQKLATGTTSKPINLSTSALLNQDGTAWSVDVGYAIKSVHKAGSDYLVYAVNTDQAKANDILRYKFTPGNDGQIKLAEDPTALTTVQLAADEKLYKRDLNKDNTWGITISSTVDAKAGLYQASIAGESWYVTGQKLASGTATKPIDLSTALFDATDSAWLPDTGYTVTAAWQKDSTTLQIYAKSGDSVLRYSFETQNGKLAQKGDAEELTGTDLAADEAAAKRDLNNDTFVGAQITASIDTVGGLHTAKILGQNYTIVGDKLASGTSSKPISLTQALKNSDGTAWAADGGYTIKAIVKESSGYSVYAVNADQNKSNDILKYSFDSQFKATGDGQAIDMVAFAAAEKAAKRDINGDTFTGVKIESVDEKGGLYKASVGGENYYVTGSKLQNGTKDKPVALETALLNEDGTRWEPDVSLTVKYIYSDNDNFYVLASNNQNSDQYSKFTFSKLTNKLNAITDTVTAIDFAAAEGLTKRDFDTDQAVGAKIIGTTDDVGGLYTAKVLDQTFYVVGSKLVTGTSSKPLDLTGALLADSDGNSWQPEDGYTVKAIIATKAQDVVTGYDVYTKGAGDDDLYISHFDKGQDGRLVLTNTSPVDTLVMTQLEVSSKRDLDGNGIFGVDITATVDEKGGLFEAKIPGATFIMAGDKLVDGTSKIPLGLSNALLDTDGSLWQKGELTPLSAVRSKDQSGVTTVTLYSQIGQDPNKVQKTIFRNTANDPQLKLVAAETDAITENQLASDEAAAKRDLNKDQLVGISIDTTAVDSVGGLYNASIMGSTYLVAGSKLISGTASKPLDLSNALLTDEATFAKWQPDTDFQIRSISKSGDNLQVVSSKGTDPTVAGYALKVSVFTKGASKGWIYDADLSKDVTTDQDKIAFSNEEFRLKRDLNADGVFSAKSTANDVIDTKGGLSLSKALGSEFYVVGLKLPDGSDASKVLNLKSALLTTDADGKPVAWKPETDLTIKSVVTNGSSVSVYAINTDGKLDDPTDPAIKKYVFTLGTTDGIQGNYLSEADTKANDLLDLLNVETSTKRDLNDDAAVGAKIDNAMFSDKSGGLYEASVLGQSFYFVGSYLSTGTSSRPLGTGFLNDVDGSDTIAWRPESGDTVKAIVKEITSGSITGYSVYAYNSNDSAWVKYNFDAGFKKSGNKEAVADITLVEKSVNRDLSGNGSVGTE